VEPGGEPERVVSLPQRPATPLDSAGPARPDLPADARPLPTVTPYDQLLRRRGHCGSATADATADADTDETVVPSSTGEAVS
jgi:hypothetical protein